MNQAELERIQDLPSEMSPINIEPEFKKLLLIRERGNKAKNFMLLESYLELGYRQFHTSKLLERTIRKDIDESILTLWDKKDLDSTESVLAIIGRLGLQNSYETIRPFADSDLDDEIKEEINMAIEEYGNNISNPYKES